MSTNPPPPLPPANPPPAVGKRSNKTLWIVLGCIGVAVFFGVALVAAILIPTVAKVRETARRTVDASNARQVVQGALIWAFEHDHQLPPVNLTSTGEPSGSTPATIHAVAAALDRDGGLFDANVWFAQTESGSREITSKEGATAPVLDSTQTALDESFAREDVFAWDFATGLSLQLPSTTPVAWTRGLRPDGTWDEDGVYGSDGGYVAFLGGNVQFYRDLQATPLIGTDGQPTSNILETLPATARVVGAGPGTLHGAVGLAPAP